MSRSQAANPQPLQELPEMAPAPARRPVPHLRLIQDAGLVVLFVALAWVVLFWRLGASTFWDPDEAHYAETSREMVATGDWWAPHYNEQPFFDKPVLFHQFQAAAMVAWGPTEFAARVVPALAGLGAGADHRLVRRGGHAIARHRDCRGAALDREPGRLRARPIRHPRHALHGMFLFGGAALVSVAALQDRPRLQWPGYIAIAVAVHGERAAGSRPVRPGLRPRGCVVSGSASTAARTATG